MQALTFIPRCIGAATVVTFAVPVILVAWLVRIVAGRA